MARRTDPTPGHQRLLALGAVSGLAAAMAFAFGRVFSGRLPTWQLIAAALASVAIAAAFERRGLLLATLASVAGLALAITWMVVPQTAWYGLPSLRTLRAVGRSLEFVGQQARVRVAPTPPLPPLMIAALTAVWTGSFSAHALAIRAGSPLLAVLPPIALVGFADTVLEDGARPVYAITLLAASLAVVFADGLRRIRQWGPIWSGSRHRRLGSAVKGSRPVAFTVIAAAVLVPGLLPGFRSAPLLDVSTDGDEGIGVDPFISIHAQLDEQAARDLFEVESPEPAYWRLYALDQFDGSTWTSSDPDGSQNGQVVQTPVELAPAPGFGIPPDAEPLPQTFRILTDLDSPWLPMAQTPEQITGPLGDITWDPYRGQALVDGGLDAGLEYAVRSRISLPTPEELDGVIQLSSKQYGRWTSLPRDALDPRIHELAEQWTEDATTAYRKVIAIQDHFHDGSFVYSTDVEPTADAAALLAFLTQTRTGFCQQFATAMAVMVRELGLPARVAVGYRTGTANEDTYLVQTKDAHAWVEVYFERYGWLQFEPTPGRGTHPNAIRPGTYLNPTVSAGGQGTEGAGQGNENGLGGSASEECVTADPQQRQLLCNTETRAQRNPGGGFVPVLPGASARVDGTGYSVPYRMIFLGLLLAFGVLLVVVPVAKSAWRRLLLRRSREPREHVLAAYRVFDGEASDLGLGRREGETVEEHRARLSVAVAFSDGHLGRLAALTIRAAYGPEAPSREDAEASVVDARRAIRDLRKDAGLLRRVVGSYRPGL
jgi:transglutaminase-like putative cysteine protease